MKKTLPLNSVGYFFFGIPCKYKYEPLLPRWWKAVMRRETSWPGHHRLHPLSACSMLMIFYCASLSWSSSPSSLLLPFIIPMVIVIIITALHPQLCILVALQCTFACCACFVQYFVICFSLCFLLWCILWRYLICVYCCVSLYIFVVFFFLCVFVCVWVYVCFTSWKPSAWQMPPSCLNPALSNLLNN